MIQPRYRQDYEGEFVVIDSQWKDGKKTQTREWVANPITNQHISGRAACIGSDIDKSTFDYTRLQKHRGGLLGNKKLQTYGVGSIATEMRLDFAVELNPNKLNEIKTTGYQVDNIVYTSPRHCIASPGEFYLIPYNPPILPEAQLLYLAAFDGHHEVFLLGYNNDTPVENPYWTNQITDVINSYKAVIFYLVGVESNMPESWRSCANTKVLTYRDFVSYCDV
jgi:hypothetical protein